MIYEIVKYKDPVLIHPSEAVTEFDETLRKFIDDMFDTMYDAHGVGLAAPQVGAARRIFVMDCSTEERTADRVVMINPEILSREGEQDGGEGCLSIPGFHSELARPARVVVRGQDANGAWQEMSFEGLEARCVCHECDHLEGTLFIDRLSPLKRNMIVRKIKKMNKAGDW